MARGGVIFNPDVQSDIDMKNTWKLVNYPSSTNILNVAQTIYVDAVNGSAGGARGTTAAFQTLAQAVAVVQAGDVIEVRSNLTYSGVVSIAVAGVTIDFRNHVITCASQTDTSKLSLGATGITIKNLEINGTWDHASSGATTGAAIRCFYPFTRLENIYVHDTMDTAFSFDGDWSNGVFRYLRADWCKQSGFYANSQNAAINAASEFGPITITNCVLGKGLAVARGGAESNKVYGVNVHDIYYDNIASGVANEGMYIHGLTDFHISNVRGTRNEFNVSCDSCDHGTIENVITRGGLSGTNQYCGLELAGCYIIDVSNCIFDGTARNGDTSDPSDNNAGIQMSNASAAPNFGKFTFSNVQSFGWASGLNIQGGSHVDIVGGYYSGANGSGAQFDGTSNVHITGAWLENVGTGMPLQLRAGSAATFSDFEIIGNYFYAGATSDSEIFLATNDVNGATLDKVNIINNTKVDTFSHANDPIHVTVGAGGAITNVVIRGNLPYSVWINDALPGSQGGTGVVNSGKTITLGGNLSTAGAVTLIGAHALTATLTADTTITLPTSGTVESQANKGQISGYASLDGTGKVPAAQLPTLSAGTIAVTSSNLKGDGAGNAVAVTATGTGDTVLATSPTLVTPTIGVATATSVNKWTLTAPSTAATLTAGADNKTYVLPETGGNVGFREIPSNSKSADYTTVLTDNGRCLLHPATDANNRTFTIDSHTNVTWPDGAAIMVENMSANNLSIAITTDTMYLAGAGTTGTRTLAQYGRALLRYTLATNSWMISGVGVS